MVQGAPLSLPLSLNPSHLLWPWIRHTPLSSHPTTELHSVLSCMCTHLFLLSLFSPYLLSLSGCQSYQQIPKQDGQTLFYLRHVFVHASQPAALFVCLPFTQMWTRVFAHCTCSSFLCSLDFTIACFLVF